MDRYMALGVRIRTTDATMVPNAVYIKQWQARSSNKGRKGGIKKSSVDRTRKMEEKGPGMGKRTEVLNC